MNTNNQQRRDVVGGQGQPEVWDGLRGEWELVRRSGRARVGEARAEAAWGWGL